MCKIPHFPHFDEIFSPLGVPLDLKSSVKNVLTFLCFADLQSALLCLHLSFSFVVGVGDYKSPGFNRSNLFLRRISNPPGRLVVVFLACAPGGGLSCLRAWRRSFLLAPSGGCSCLRLMKMFFANHLSPITIFWKKAFKVLIYREYSA